MIKECPNKVNYVCRQNCILVGKDETIMDIRKNFYVGDKVYLNFNYSIELLPTDIKPTFKLKEVGEWCHCLISNRGEYAYLKTSEVMRYFAPIRHKHFEVKIFDNLDKLNDELESISIECVKDIKETKSGIYMLIYINMEDDEDEE